MKFLVCGCNGMAGHTISLYLSEQGYDVFGFDIKESKIIDSVVGNAMDGEFVKGLIDKGDFDVIINCIGVLNKAADDNKALAVYLNSYWPHFLSQIVHNSKARIFHMSTDCVFSGEKGNYTEYDYPDGKTFYDRSKALGELKDDKNLTLRNSIIGPDINPKGIGLLNWFLQQKGTVNGYTKSMWTGQTTLQLAKTMEYAALNKSSGIVNAVPDNAISKYELLNLFNKYFRGDSLIITPVDGINADKSLIRTNYSMDYIVPGYETMVAELAEWVTKHKDLYPHYCI